MSFWGYRDYVPVAQRRAKAIKQLEKLRKKGKDIQPVDIEGRAIARSFWGKGWCDHLESFSDYSNRLPRGRTYVRNGSVCHLEILPGRIEAMVSGSSPYTVKISIQKLQPAAWKAIKQKCSGQIGSMLELLQGKLSDQVMTVVSDRKDGLFPQSQEIKLSCSCPDWAVMCKHVAAVLYGVGSRLDTRPELLFELRGVDAAELIATELVLPGAADSAADSALADDQLSNIFGVDLDSESQTDGSPVPEAKPAGRPRRDPNAKPRREKKARPVKAKKTAKGAQGTRPTIRPTGKSVALLRKKLGLSVEGFAEALGVSMTSVYKWESAKGQLKMQKRTLEAVSALRQKSKAK